MSQLPDLHSTAMVPVGVQFEADLAGLPTQTFPEGITIWCRETQLLYIWNPQSTATTIPGESVAVATGGAFVVISSALSGIFPRFNVKNFGAVGNGIVNDTTAIQATIDAASAANAGVYFPSGTYGITAGVLTVTGTQGMQLISENGGNSGSAFVPTLLCLGGHGAMLKITNARRTVLTGISFDGAGIADWGCQIVDVPPGSNTELTNATNCHSRNCKVWNWLCGQKEYKFVRSGNKLQVPAHGFINDDTVRMVLAEPTQGGAGALPNPLVVGTKYFIVNATTDDFELSLTSGGATIVLTTDGYGQSVVSQTNGGNASAAIFTDCDSWPSTVGVKTIGNFRLRSDNSFCTTFNGGSFNGNIQVIFEVTADNTTETLTGTLPAGFGNGDAVRLWSSLNNTNRLAAGGALPTGLVADQTYYVINKTATTFQLALTPTGSAINLTTNGAGAIWCIVLWFPWYTWAIQGGTAELTDCVSAIALTDIWGDGEAAGQGFGITVVGFESQSWAMADLNTVDHGNPVDQRPIAFNNCSHQDILGGSSRSGTFKLSGFAPITISGHFARDIWLGPNVVTIDKNSTMFDAVVAPATGTVADFIGSTTIPLSGGHVNAGQFFKYDFGYLGKLVDFGDTGVRTQFISGLDAFQILSGAGATVQSIFVSTSLDIIDLSAGTGSLSSRVSGGFPRFLWDVNGIRIGTDNTDATLAPIKHLRKYSTSVTPGIIAAGTSYQTTIAGIAGSPLLANDACIVGIDPALEAAIDPVAHVVSNASIAINLTNTNAAVGINVNGGAAITITVYVFSQG